MEDVKRRFSADNFRERDEKLHKSMVALVYEIPELKNSMDAAVVTANLLSKYEPIVTDFSKVAIAKRDTIYECVFVSGFATAVQVILDGKLDIKQFKIEKDIQNG